MKETLKMDKFMMLLFFSLVCHQGVSQDLEFATCDIALSQKEDLLSNIDSLNMFFVEPLPDTLQARIDQYLYDLYNKLDSIHPDTVKNVTRNLPTRKIKIIILRKNNLALLEESSYCSLLLYATIFDRLLSGGLDIDDITLIRGHYIKGDPVSASKLSWQEKRRFYKNYLKMKQLYRRYIHQVFSSNIRQKMVNKLLNENEYSDPEKLRRILLSLF